MTSAASSLVSYSSQRGVATLTLDDGKRNALNPRMFDALYEALERAEKERVAVVITGREGVLSAGFDLKVMKSGGVEAMKMLRSGYGLTARLLSFPMPVVIASPGHAYAMGVFLLLSGDYRIGAKGPYLYSANEVAIGLPMPRVGAEVLRLRLAPAARERAVTLAEAFSPDEALASGIVDELCEVAELLERAQQKAEALLKLDMDAHRVSKLRIRAEVLENIRAGIPLDLADALAIGAKQLIQSKFGRK